MRRRRESAGLTVSLLAPRVAVGASMLSKIETGSRGTKRETAEALDRELGASGELVTIWGECIQRARLPDWHSQITKAEERATEIRTYSPAVVPGLLQTTDYSAVLFRDGEPGISDWELAKRVKIRAERLGVLLERGPDLRFVFPESVLRTTVGDSRIMREQLDRLVTLSESGAVRIQVLPDDCGSAIGVAVSGFRVLSYSDRGPSAYAESVTGGSAVDDPADIRRLAAVFAELAAWAADPRRSIQMIKERIDA